MGLDDGRAGCAGGAEAAAERPTRTRYKRELVESTSMDESRYSQPSQEAGNEQEGADSSATEPDDGSGGSSQNNDTIEDSSGNRYLKKEILRIILSYKKNTRNFFWGDLQRSCSKMNRKFDDRWYPWTRDMMESIDQNEEKMRSIVLRHSHSRIQEICREVGGDMWRLQTASKLNRCVANIRQIEDLVRSKEGMDTCWGVMKYSGVLRSKVESRRNQMRRRLKKKCGILDYIRYKSRLWDEHYRRQAEKDDISRLYNKN